MLNTGTFYKSNKMIIIKPDRLFFFFKNGHFFNVKNINKIQDIFQSPKNKNKDKTTVELKKKNLSHGATFNT